MIKELDVVDWIPAHVKTTATGLAAVKPSLAEYVLADVRPRLISQTYVGQARYGSSASVTLHVPFKALDMTAMYVPTDTSLAAMTRTGRIIFSRAQCGFDSMPYNVWNVNDQLAYLLRYGHKGGQATQDEILLVLQLITGKKRVPYTQVSSGHLRYLTFREVKRMKVPHMRTAIEVVAPLLASLYGKGLHESMAVGILLWAILLPPDYLRLAKGCAALDRCNSVEAFMDQAKKLSVRAKAMQGNLVMNLAPFFEMNVLANRGVGTLDWAKERDNRERPNLTTITPEQIYDKATQLFKQSVSEGRGPHRMRWKTFFNDRWSWAPTGSYHSQWAEDLEGLPKPRELRNKFYMFSKMGHRDFQHFAGRPQEMHAWASTKWEWGKMRAIYGVDITSFVLGAFGFLGCEDALPNDFPVGSRANDDYVSRKLDAIMPGRAPYCLDYEDFNSQHSIEGMQAVMRAYVHVFKGQLDEQQQHAIAWFIGATAKEIIHYREGATEHTYRTKGTMLSGWRLTSFMNSVLNWVYTHTVTDPVVATVGVHNGDDVLLPVDTYKQVKKIEGNLKRHNLRSQPPKCNLAGIAEFLRVDHSGGEGSQYLARAVATYVHGRTEAIIPNNLAAVLAALRDRETELLKRKARPDILEELTRTSLTRVAEVWRIRPDFDLRAVYDAHKLAGGTSDTVRHDLPSQDRWFSLVVRELPGREEELNLSTILPGAHDYALNLAANLFTQADVKRIARRATRAVYASLATTRVTIEESRNPYGLSIHWLSNYYKQLRGMTSYGRIALAKAYGFPAISDSSVKDSSIYARLMATGDAMLWSKLLL